MPGGLFALLEKSNLTLRIASRWRAIGCNVVLDGGSGWLDILVVNEQGKIARSIENEIFSPESGCQLNVLSEDSEVGPLRCHQASRVPVAHQHGSRSLGGPSVPGTSQLQRHFGHWCNRWWRAAQGAISEDIRWFLRQYAGTSRRKIMPVP